MRYLAIVAVLFALGCSKSTDPGCDVCTTSAVVFGSITDHAGSPVVGMPLDIRVFAEGCGSGSMRGGSDSGVPRTDGAGQYRATVLSLFSPFTARCFVLTSNPNAQGDWPTAQLEQPGALELRADYNAGPRDSIRIDFQLPTP
jgi:hypothetical protein